VIKILKIRQLEDIKGIKRGKEKVKISLFADYVILFIKDPKISTRKCLHPITTFSKAAG